MQKRFCFLARAQWYHTKQIKPIKLIEGEQKWVSATFMQDAKPADDKLGKKKHRSSFPEFYQNIEKNDTVAQASLNTVRLDQALSKQFGISRQYALFLIENGHVKKNGKITQRKAELVLQGDKMDIFLQQRQQQTHQNKEMMEPLLELYGSDILYEDGDILVVNKPAGYAVHAGPGNPYHSTVICAAREYVKQQQTNIIPKFPIHVGIAHRLDKDTSGVLVCGKHTHAVKELSTQFQTVDACKKLYCAICTSALPSMENLPIYKQDAFIDDDDADDEPKQPTKQTPRSTMSDDFAEDENEDMIGNDWYKEQTRQDEKSLTDMGEYEHLQVQDKPARNTMLESIKGEIIIDQPIAALNNYMYTMGNNEIVDEEIAHKTEAKNAKSIVRIIDVNEQERILLAVVKIMTGRTHQVRSHLASISLPVLGDLQYTTQTSRIPLAVAKKLHVRRMQLHCRQLSFAHPITGKSLRVRAPLPPDMQRIVDRFFTSEQAKKLSWFYFIERLAFLLFAQQQEQTWVSLWQALVLV